MLTQILQIISIHKINKPYTLRLSLGAGLPRVPDSSPGKSALGKGWGTLGEGPPALAAPQRAARRAVPVRRSRSLTGIDSKARGSPSPNRKRIVLTGPIEHFQFETLCVANHTVWRFAEKTRFFRSLWAGRRCASCLVFCLFQRQNALKSTSGGLRICPTARTESGKTDSSGQQGQTFFKPSYGE